MEQGIGRANVGNFIGEHKDRSSIAWLPFVAAGFQAEELQAAEFPEYAGRLLFKRQKERRFWLAWLDSLILFLILFLSRAREMSGYGAER
jgi:hypothetical protein